MQLSLVQRLPALLAAALVAVLVAVALAHGPSSSSSSSSASPFAMAAKASSNVTIPEPTTLTTGKHERNTWCTVGTKISKKSKLDMCDADIALAKLCQTNKKRKAKKVAKKLRKALKKAGFTCKGKLGQKKSLKKATKKGKKVCKAVLKGGSFKNISQIMKALGCKRKDDKSAKAKKSS